MSQSTRVDQALVDQLIELWVRLLREAFMLAKGEYLNRLSLVRVDYRDARGLHPYSLVWGGIETVQHLLPGLHELGIVDPVSMKAEARTAAIEEFEARLHDARLSDLVERRTK